MAEEQVVFHSGTYINSQALRVRQGERLVFRRWNRAINRNLDMVARVITKSGRMVEIREKINLSAAATNTEVELVLPEGQLIFANASLSAATMNLGYCFIMVYIRQAASGIGFPAMNLASGWVSTFTAIQWPYPTFDSSIANPEAHAYSEESNPSAGADWSYSVPADTTFRLLSFYGELVTDANVANRYASIEVYNESPTLELDINFGYAHAASQTVRYSAGEGMGCCALAGSGKASAGIPRNATNYGGKVSTNTTNKQAGDQWQNIVIHFVAEPQMLT